MRIHDVPQRSDEWYALRLGAPTASMFSTVVVEGEGRETYLRRLVAELISGQARRAPTNWHMRRGLELEPKVRAKYEFETGFEVSTVGFIMGDHGAGCSPDGLIGSNGCWECKTVLAEKFIEYWLANTTGWDFFAQCQGQMWISERQWCDLAVHDSAEGSRLPMLIERIQRDDHYIANKLEPAVRRLIRDRDAIITDYHLTGYGQAIYLGASFAPEPAVPVPDAEPADNVSQLHPDGPAPAPKAEDAPPPVKPKGGGFDTIF